MNVSTLINVLSALQEKRSFYQLTRHEGFGEAFVLKILKLFEKEGLIMLVEVEPTRGAKYYQLTENGKELLRLLGEIK